MPDSTQQLVFKLIIDGKEAVATLDSVTGEFKVTGETADKLTEKVKEQIKVYAGLISEATKYNTVSEDSVRLLSNYISSQGLSIEQIQNSIKSLDEETNALAINSEERRVGMVASANLKATLGQLLMQDAGLNNESMRLSVTQRSLAHTFFLVGQMAGNADDFIGNAKLGLRSFSFFLPELVRALNEVRESAAATGTTVTSQLAVAFASGGGLVLGIQGLMLLLNLMPGLFSKTTEAIADQTVEVKKLADEYDKLTREQIKSRLLDLNTQLDELEKKYPSETKFIPSFDPKRVFGGLSPFYREQVADKSRFGDDAEAVEKLKLKISLLEREALYKGIIDDADIRLKANQEKLNNLNKENFALIVVGAKSYDEARKTLEAWIAADKKITDTKNSNEEKFAESKKSAVEKFIQEEIKRNEASRLAGMDYAALLVELENAEKDYGTIVGKLKEAKSKEELEATEKFADLTKFRIGVIQDYVKDFLKEMDDVDKELEDQGEEIEKFLIQTEEDRQKFETDKTKFIAETEKKINEQTTAGKIEQLNKEEGLEIKRLQQFGATEELITNLKRYYENERLKIAQDAHLEELNLIQDKINQIQSAYSQIYGIISQSVKQEIDDWKSSEEQKLESERKAALSHAQSQDQRQKINEQYDKKKEAIEKEADKRARERLETWFELQKAIAIAEISINLAKAIGVEWGKLGTFALFTQGLVIATLTAQLYAVSKQTFPKGFAEGGRLPKGRAGIIEGTHNEIIAPEEDFKTVFKSYSADLVKHALIDYRISSGASLGSSSSDLSAIKDELSGLKSTVNKLNNLLDDGIDARAVYDEDAAERLYLKGKGKYRRGKI